LKSVTIPDSVTSIGGGFGEGAFEDCTNLASVAIGNGVTTIGSYAFFSCTTLKSVTIGNGVTSIGDSAFQGCAKLKSVLFEGDAPIIGSSEFTGDSNATIYYLPGTAGWGATFGGRPAMLWNPQMQSLEVSGNQLGFTITGASNLVVVVQACSDPLNPAWSPLATLTLTNGSSNFSDPIGTNYANRFYRISSP
jgi:hypothetical protein